MPDKQKITVLLADEDVLRRDGLASVLRENTEIEVVAGCADGQTALEKIRDLCPEVAIVDLNLPGLHGIELVRRIRGESLATKIIILSGTMDEEIVREVVRAGADAYLLKNGPARHLTDAISYVRDGGQYFSPQLRRDGRNRDLLEEPPRISPDHGDDSGVSGDDNGHPRQNRRSRPRTADPARLRERLREETSRNLQDRDYDIMAEMADGIRPILDRLDEIEDRVVDMESGSQPLPPDPRGWLSEQLNDTLTTSRASQERGARTSYRGMEAKLPELIEEAVTKRFQSMAGKLQAEIEEQHVRTLETFVKNIQVKLVQRVSVLEHNMQHQAEAMLQLREYNQRTEDNLSRLITGVDKLAQELPKRLAAAQQQQGEIVVEQPMRKSLGEAGVRDAGQRDIGGQKDRRPAQASGINRKKLLPIAFWVFVLAAITVAVVYGIRSGKDDSSNAKAPPVGKEIEAARSKAIADASKPPALPAVAAGTDTKTKLDAAKQYMDRQEYSTAEDIYKQVVASDPKNVDALAGLASALYRQNKMEESADVLERIPKN
jgi:DNA-binding NarL/FixJ family response regulator/tetratricopeptide (TPR) repeat protein